MDQQVMIANQTPFAPIVQLVIDGLDSEHSRRGYALAIRDFLTWYVATNQKSLSRAVVLRYVAQLRDHLDMAPNNINRRLVAIRRLAREAALNELIAESTSVAIEQIQGVRQEGHQIGNWLTKQQALDLLALPDTTRLIGKRDRTVLAILLGCGLRREELSALTVEHIQQREGRWAIVDLVGKRQKVRSIPMAGWTKVVIDAWLQASGIRSGEMLRSMDKGDRLTDVTLSPVSIARIVHHYGELLDVPDLAPHDLRRTFAKLAYKGGARIDQISLSLGHESIETTQRYLGLDQDFTDAPADHLGLSLGA
jgi:integrase